MRSSLIGLFPGSHPWLGSVGSTLTVTISPALSPGWAVKRVEEGYSQQEVAEFLGVSKASVSQWMKAFREGGSAGLAAKNGSGRPRKLTAEQEAEVLTWFERSPTEFGYRNELWTAPRVAEQIRKTWGVKFHPRYLNS